MTQIIIFIVVVTLRGVHVYFIIGVQKLLLFVYYKHNTRDQYGV